MDRHQRIASLNDAFRRSMAGGRMYITRGVADLAEPDQVAILAKVRAFDAFNEANDPYGEHDYGSFDQAGERILWKIDYYDAQDMEAGSEDPPVLKEVRQAINHKANALDLDDGQHVLWGLCAAFSTLNVLAHTVQARIASLAKETGRLWYGRGEA